jgi:two-component sensor histidine kinase
MRRATRNGAARLLCGQRGNNPPSSHAAFEICSQLRMKVVCGIGPTAVQWSAARESRMNLEDLYRLLRAGHVQSQGIVDTLTEPLLVLDHGYNVLAGNLAFFETFQVTKDDTLGQCLFDLGDGQWDIPALRVLLSKVVPQSTAVLGYEVQHDFPVLGLRTMLVSARRLVHPESNSTSMLLVFDDVTEGRRTEAEKDILLAETRHRMKNLLATVRAIANRTATDGRSAVEYREAFLGRFNALMDAQDVALSGRSAADFAEIMQRAVRVAGGEDALVCRGPSVPVPAHQVLSLSFVVHELTTNALKHGALSAPGGSVLVEWSVASSSGGQEMLLIKWREENGPRVAPPKRSGFGSKLIEFSVKEDLGGTAELHFPPEGFKCSISVPIG